MENEDLSQSSKEVARGSFWSLAGNVFFKFTSFFYTIILARAASQDDIGLFFLSLGVVSLVSVIADLGLPMSLPRYIPYFKARKEGSKIRYLLKMASFLVLGTSLLITAAVFLLAEPIGQLYESTVLPDALRVMSAYILLYSGFKFVSQYLQSRADIKSMQLVRNVQNAAKLFITLALFWLFGASFLTIAAGFLLSFLLSLVVALPIVGKRILDIPNEVVEFSKGGLLKEVIPFGIMVSIVTTFSVVIWSSDKVILGYLLPASESLELVGVYTLATTIAMVLLIFPQSIAQIFLPVMSKLVGKDNKKEMRSTLGTAERWAVFVALPIALVMVTFSGDLLSILYGDAYRTGATALAIFTMAKLFFAFAMMLSLSLAAMRLVKLELAISAVTALTNILLNFLLIPVMGMEGAALASAASLLLFFLLMLHYAKKVFDFTLPGEIYRMCAAGLLAFAIIFVLQPYFSPILQLFPETEGDYLVKAMHLGYIGILTAISIVIFAGFSLLLKSFHREDIILLRKILRRMRLPENLIGLVERVASYGVPAPK
jgi:O-antigen/teichoic acid export membrane protein